MDTPTLSIMVPQDLLQNLNWHPGADGCWHPADQTAA